MIWRVVLCRPQPPFALDYLTSTLSDLSEGAGTVPSVLDRATLVLRAQNQEFRRLLLPIRIPTSVRPSRVVLVLQADRLSPCLGPNVHLTVRSHAACG